jgi:hypothetical protein
MASLRCDGSWERSAGSGALLFSALDISGTSVWWPAQAAAMCGVAWGLVYVREGTRTVDPAWYTRQTPISEDKGPYSETRGRQRGGLQRFRACESSHDHQVATAAMTAILPSVM